MRRVKGKTRLCQSTLSDFKIELVNGSLFYNRYAEFSRVFNKHMRDMQPDVIFAQPVENPSKKTIDWYAPQFDETPITLAELKKIGQDAYDHYLAIYKEVVKRLKDISSSITNKQEKAYFDIAIGSLENDYFEDATYCHDNIVTFVVWGMSMLKGRSITTVITDEGREHRIHKVNFVVQGNGELSGKTSFLRKHGHILEVKEIPKVIPSANSVFTEWLPEAPQGKTVMADITYTAVCKPTEEPTPPPPGPEPPEGGPGVTPPPVPPTHRVSFSAGEHGKLNGQESCEVNDGECIQESQIPKIEPEKGYTFAGWDKSTDNPITGDTTYNAVYKKEPWWKRLWHTFWGDGCLTKGCLTWLLRLLLLALLALLLWWLLRSCVGCSGHGVNGVAPLDSVTRSDGTVVDDNGVARPVTGNDGKLPDKEGIVAPVRGEDGAEVPIVRRPGQPNVIGNRLFLFLENESDNIEALAKDFKEAYPEDKYSIIGYDKEVKLLVIQIPEEERDQIRETINGKIPNHKFLVFDEEIYELNGQVSGTNEDKGWHLNAIHLKQGWTYTQGSPQVRIAVVDDGIQADHPMFKGRIADAYNVYTQNNRLSRGNGHGTHTAGLAAGSADYFSQGAAGVAPKCTLIPVQVFDNSQCPLSALVAGVMYAIHHDADVVNISIGPSFQGLNALPVEQQDAIAKTQFGNVATLWARVCKLAAEKRCILVFAAGNDDILTSIPPENRNASSIVVTAVDRRFTQRSSPITAHARTCRLQERTSTVLSHRTRSSRATAQVWRRQ